MRLSSALLVAPILLSSVSAQDASPRPDGLIIKTTKEVPCTRKSQDGDRVSMMYRGTLASNGKEFDGNLGSDRAFTFVIGKGRVIKGWDLGLLDMCVGEWRNLTIPPELAYGESGTGPIPPDSTLVFETELVNIAGVDDRPPPSSKDRPIAPVEAEESADLAPVLDVEVPQPQGSKDGPKAEQEDEETDGECRLLGPFALVVQGALGALALLSLVWKRWRESPRRPIKIWWFDASKQVFGSVLLHLANLFMSMLSSGSFDVKAKTKQAAEFVQDDERKRPNPCSFYLLNLAIDTTIGIAILVVLLRVFHALFLRTPLANPPQSIKSGNYGHPPRFTWWLKQSFIYFLGLFCMKFCVFLIFKLLPWIGWVGDWALRWTEGKEWVQIAFVMLIFPLIMNALQYYIIDSFIKEDPNSASSTSSPDGNHRALPQDDRFDDGDDGYYNSDFEVGDSDIDSDEDEAVRRSTDADGTRVSEAAPLKKGSRRSGMRSKDSLDYDPKTDGENGINTGPGKTKATIPQRFR